MYHITAPNAWVCYLVIIFQITYAVSSSWFWLFGMQPGRCMGLLSDTQNYELRMRWECRARSSRHRGLAIPTFITARASRTCRDACRDRYLAVSFEVGGGENVPGIPGACATRNFTYLVRGPLHPWGSLCRRGISRKLMMNQGNGCVCRNAVHPQK